MQSILGKSGGWSLFRHSPGFYFPSLNSEKKLKKGTKQPSSYSRQKGGQTWYKSSK